MAKMEGTKNRHRNNIFPLKYLFCVILISSIAVFQCIKIVQDSSPGKSTNSNHQQVAKFRSGGDILSAENAELDGITTFEMKDNSNYNRTSNNLDVIVYLAQFGHHSSYGKQTDGKGNEITGTSKLNRSLSTLYHNYVNDFPCDVIVFYGEDDNPDPGLLKSLQNNRPRLHFEQLQGQWWSLPPGLTMKGHKRWKLPGFSVGYRHMIRWYSCLVWPYLTDKGYTHVMRMDDDSYIYSVIKYNLFDYMRKHGKRYAFRQPTADSIGVGYLNTLIDEFLEVNPNVSKPELVEDYHRQRTLGFYNNWFIADISFFLTPPVSTFLDIVDKSHIMYTQRTNDLLIQSVMVRLFLWPNEIHWFQDFTYEHMTVKKKHNSTCPSVGGLTRGNGTDESQWRTISEDFLSRFDSDCMVYKIVREEPYIYNGTYDCLGSKICQLESLNSRHGYYLKKIIQN